MMENIKDFENMVKLNLSEEERPWATELAGKLIESFGALSSIDTSEVEPMITVLDVQNVLRDDVCVKTVTREELLSNAPGKSGGYFQVPRTLE